MTVRINRTDQLIGTDWIRKANPERPAVGRVLPTVGRSRTLAKNVRVFIARGCPDYLGDLSWYFLWILLVLLITLQTCIRFVGKPPYIIDIGKRIFMLNISTTTAKYFHTSDITGFSKSLIVSTLFSSLSSTLIWNAKHVLKVAV